MQKQFFCTQESNVSSIQFCCRNIQPLGEESYCNSFNCAVKTFNLWANNPTPTHSILLMKHLTIGWRIILQLIQLCCWNIQSLGEQSYCNWFKCAVKTFSHWVNNPTATHSIVLMKHWTIGWRILLQLIQLRCWNIISHWVNNPTARDSIVPLKHYQSLGEQSYGNWFNFVVETFSHWVNNHTATDSIALLKHSVTGWTILLQLIQLCCRNIQPLGEQSYCNWFN